MSEGNSNNKTTALAGLLNKLDLPTIAMVVLMGGGNWLTTKSGNDINEAEIRRAIEEIHSLYPKLTEAIDRQKRMQESLDALRAGRER